MAQVEYNESCNVSEVVLRLNAEEARAVFDLLGKVSGSGRRLLTSAVYDRMREVGQLLRQQHPEDYTHVSLEGLQLTPKDITRGAIFEGR